ITERACFGCRKRDPKSSVTSGQSPATITTLSRSATPISTNMTFEELKAEYYFYPLFTSPLYYLMCVVGDRGSSLGSQCCTFPWMTETGSSSPLLAHSSSSTVSINVGDSVEFIDILLRFTTSIISLGSSSVVSLLVYVTVAMLSDFLKLTSDSRWVLRNGVPGKALSNPFFPTNQYVEIVPIN
uniref:Uncharacterized protein n=1 Tax=Strigamia maritima TaxID=126957 RepID=T1JKB8_STRMM